MTEMTEAQTGSKPLYKKWWFWAAIGAVLIIGAVSVITRPEPVTDSVTPVTVSNECANALETFGNVDPADLDGEAAALTTTTQACPTAEEYMLAVHENPGTWFYKSSKDIDDNLVLTSACADNMTQPMCVNAKSEGLIK